MYPWKDANRHVLQPLALPTASHGPFDTLAVSIEMVCMEKLKNGVYSHNP